MAGVVIVMLNFHRFGFLSLVFLSGVLNLHISKFDQFEEMYTFMFTFPLHFKVCFSYEL